MRSDIDLVVRASKRLERLLAQRYGACGRGLHAQVSSVERHLPADVVPALRWIATMRNKVLHEDGFRLKDRRHFRAEVKRVERVLGTRHSARWVAAGLLLVLAALLAWSLLA